MRSLNTADYLQIFDSLPNLLVLAHEQTLPDADIYRVQLVLREQYRRQGMPFKYLRPLRHFYHCPLCDISSREILYELENPAPGLSAQSLRVIKLLDSEIHQLRFHNAALNDDHSLFLTSISHTSKLV